MKLHRVYISIKNPNTYLPYSFLKIEIPVLKFRIKDAITETYAQRELEAVLEYVKGQLREIDMRR